MEPFVYEALPVRVIFGSGRGGRDGDPPDDVASPRKPHGAAVMFSSGANKILSLIVAGLLSLASTGAGAKRPVP